MTVDELRQEAQLYTELEIASNLALSAVNEFLQRLGSKALITAIVDMNPTSKGFIPLPSNCIKVQWVDVKSTGESFDKYRTRQGMIAFDTPNEVYTVTYIKTPAIVTDASSVMEIHESYRGALRLYIEGWIKANDDEEENPDSIRLREQAWADAQAVYEDLSAAYRPSREAPVDYSILCVDTLRREAERSLSTTIEEHGAIACINEFIQRLGELSRTITNTDITPSAENVSIDLPAGCIKVLGVTIKSSALPYSDYWVRNGQISFRDVDTYTIKYLILPDLVTSATAVINLSQAFRGALLMYLKGWAAADRDMQDSAYAEAMSVSRLLSGRKGAFQITVSRR